MREWLKSARDNKGLTMEQLSKKLDITESYYSLIERGERQKRMDIMLVMKLSEALAIPVQDIIANESE